MDEIGEQQVRSAIEAAELRKTYPPGVAALDGLSLSVEEGTIFALLGPNGAGKSTTVRVLCTLSRPDGGTARVAGLDVLADPVGVRRAIGVVGQKHGSDGEATGSENLVLQGEFYGITGRELRRRVAESLERFGLRDAAGRKVKTYSGGMQRRLDIAMGLLHRPQVLFLDEPTTGLDPEARAELWVEIERLRADQQMTILLTTHYMEEADQLCNRVAIMDHGKLLALDTPAALKRSIGADTIVTVKADGDGRALADELARRIPGITRSRVLTGGVELHVTGAERLVPRVVAAAEAGGFELVDISVAEPTLETVFIQLTGKELRD
jgi:ABC-2 type transport system ATP-binding protein